jgi:poly(A) polymerase
VRFAAKLAGLGFKIEPKTKAAILPSLPLLQEVPQSRLFDEMLKLLQTGHALATIEQLKVLGMARGIYPLLDLIVERAEEPFVRAALQDTDRRVGENKPVAPSFLLACVLWSDVRDGWQDRTARRMHPFPALQESIDEVFDARIGDISGRGKLGADMREIWMMQPRFEKRSGQTPFTLVEQPRFRAAFDFMRLRADVGEVDVVLADWWQEFSQASDIVREDLVAALRDEQSRQQRRTRRVKPQGEGEGEGEGARDAAPVQERAARAPAGEPQAPQGGDGESAGGDAPRKRRRRRRKPAGQGGGESTDHAASAGDSAE